MNDVYTTAPVPTLDETYVIGRTQGIKAEQERIIKLLANRMSELKLYQSMLAEAPEVWDKRTIYLTLESAIALIKGEK